MASQIAAVMGLGFHNIQTANMAEFASVERGYGPPPMKGSRGNDQVVGTDHFAGGGELRPDSGMRASHPGVDRYHFQAPKEFLDPAAPAAGARGVRLYLNTKPQFAEGNDTDRYRFRRPRMKPDRQVETLTLVGDQQ